MKVAAYCRVSTDKSDQVNSFEGQQRYFREYIAQHDDWELYEIYADEGVTGTSTKKRTAFNRMISDARLHRFELIITKEVSRFSRNILDAVFYTRELKRLGVGVRFLSDGIDTLHPDAELRLSIMGSIAQEESRRTSARVKWGQTRRMEQGVVFGRSMLGYDVRDGQMTINPEGAEIVKLIFHKYIYEHKGTTVIARELREEGRKTAAGSTCWRNTAVLKILRNEKYCGDLKQKKTITPDYLTHQKKYNHGEEEFVFIKDHHEPIIDRDLFEEVQREIARRDLDGMQNTGHGHRYPLSGKIRCGGCGRYFVSRIRRRTDGRGYRVWRCSTAANEGSRKAGQDGGGAGCPVGFQLRDDVALNLVRQSLAMLKMDKEPIISDITNSVIKAALALKDGEYMSAAGMKAELEHIRDKKKRVLDAFFSKDISENDMKLMNTEYDRRAALIFEKIAAAEKRAEKYAGEGTLEDVVRAKVSAIAYGCEMPDDFCGRLLDRIDVLPDRRVEVRLKSLPFVWTYALKDGPI